MSDTSAYFVMTLPLRPEAWQKDKLNKRFEINRQIYNALLGEGLKRYRRMKERRDYRELVRELDSTANAGERKKIYQGLDLLTAEFRLRRFDFTKEATKYRKFFRDHTDAPVIQNLAVQAWKAIQSLICRRACSVHWKQEDELYSLEGKTNKTSIRYQDGKVIWKGLEIPARVKGNAYEREAFAQEIRYCRLKWKWIRGQKKYYVDLVFRGKCPVKQTNYAEIMKKEDRETFGKAAQTLTENEKKTVGMDIGLQRVVLVTDEEIRDLKLPGKNQALERERIYYARKLERSRRLNHPENYTEDGRILSGRKKWDYSINYRKNKLKYREILRRQKVFRDEEQKKLIREILDTGDIFYAEQLEFENMRKRKERQSQFTFGRPVENVAAAAFLRTLEWKIHQRGKQIFFVNPRKALAGSINHATGVRETLPYYKKYRSIEGNLLDKQVYSAFLLRHANPDTGMIDLEACSNTFAAFLTLHKETYGS